MLLACISIIMNGDCITLYNGFYFYGNEVCLNTPMCTLSQESQL